ncbi:C_GCAxxG_C_C family probable redox protein [Desulfosporosinus orientis DSM 765]|uniref:C_GCAxxG_C_C family probable redox protein n=1 Tax=Desulfosporosinus orientis (strain ATCC 19365 / DSM 765 / NCIMB 8382 / VKM B-1628 / Singapore I) TaxID=768706 RepID=G7WF51_DESOD|nr:C-GCAxxG-C-C family protein [Desulfosporosinus orientis]AET67662.1 C_GCAxxG_C_C family probable redox protein [Desulfosporosinus orientis DSM 765]
MEDLALEARNRAGNKFKSGLNCSESILHTYNELLKHPLSPEALKVATGFGGGLGHAGCVCGALNASVMVLGLFRGRNDPGHDRKPAYDLAHEFHDRFSNEYGATCCRVLNQHEFDSPEHLRRCLKLTGGTAKLLMEFIKEKNLLDESFSVSETA